MKYAVRQVRAGRRIGCRQNSQDILSPQIRRDHGLKIERIDRRDPQNGVWDQLLVEDHRTGPAEVAASRIDFSTWLQMLSKRNRRIARSLALGESTNSVAEQFGLSAGRISQLRNWFLAHWEQYQGGVRRMVAPPESGLRSPAQSAPNPGGQGWLHCINVEVFGDIMGWPSPNARHCRQKIASFRPPNVLPSIRVRPRTLPKTHYMSPSLSAIQC